MEEILANVSPDTVFLVENKGAKFSVGLVANSGTGYQWKQKTLTPPNVVRFLGEKTIPIGTPKPGSPLEFRFDYEAVKDGTVNVQFDLIGPDKKIAKTDTFDFVVT